jgi:hypothetical protein
MIDKSKLHVIPEKPPARPEPSLPLGAVGRSLWDRITSAYDISDEGGIELLSQACASADRAESLRAQIDRDGEVVRTKQGFKDHPALKHELGARSFVVRVLTKMGLAYEPLKSPGRPLGEYSGITETWER